VQNNEMAETESAQNVLLKLKPLSASTHEKEMRYKA
jgi:hypothetical protein